MPTFRNTKREPFPFDTSDGNARSVGGRAKFEVDKVTSMLPAFRHALNTGRIVEVKDVPKPEPETKKAIIPPPPPPPLATPTPVPEPPASEPTTDSPGLTADTSADDSAEVAPEDAQDPPAADTDATDMDASGEPEPPREGATTPTKKRKKRRGR